MLYAAQWSVAGPPPESAGMQRMQAAMQPIFHATHAPQHLPIDALLKQHLHCPVPASVIATPATPPVNLDAWLRPVEAWTRIGLQAIATSQASIPQAAHALALLATGMEAGILLARQLQTQGRPCCCYTTLASLSEPILGQMFPRLHAANLFRQAAADAALAGICAGETTPFSATRGQALGRDIAATVLEQIPAITTTPHDAVPPPPAWESAEFAGARAQFVTTQRLLSDADRALAQQWAYGLGSVTIIGAWFKHALDLIGRAHHGMQATARILRVLGAILDSTAASIWAAKQAYQAPAATTWMQQRHPEWHPVIALPEYPAYPSAHAAISAAAAETLAYFFPAHSIRLRQSAQVAAQTRVLAGVQWEPSCRIGLLHGHHLALHQLGSDVVQARAA